MSHNQLAHIAGFGDHKATLYGVRIMRAIEELGGSAADLALPQLRLEDAPGV